jgi:hypothetical protein
LGWAGNGQVGYYRLSARDRCENLDRGAAVDRVIEGAALDLVAVHEQLHELVDAAAAVEDQLVEAREALADRFEALASRPSAKRDPVPGSGTIEATRKPSEANSGLSGSAVSRNSDTMYP